MTDIGVGLIGTGFMGKCHALAWSSVRAVFGDVPQVRLEMLCDLDRDSAQSRAATFGFTRWTTNWREVMADGKVDVVSITAPNALHRSMVEEAAKHGKAIWCEKPLGLTLEDAEAMCLAVNKAGVASLTGYNYLRNPAIIHARKLVREGSIGRLIQFRGFCDEDYMADTGLPYTWRCRVKDAGPGALGDLTVHLVAIARYLAGEIDEVMGDVRIVYETRPDAEHPGRRGKVENEDQANALLRFSSGVQGLIMSSRVAWGRKNHLGFEIHGSTGMITFDQERMNELRLFRHDGPREQQGFTTILSGPAHPPYGDFIPAGGHGLGFNDLKVIEAAHLLRGMTGREKIYPDMDEARRIERVIHAIIASSRQGKWLAV